MLLFAVETIPCNGHCKLYHHFKEVKNADVIAPSPKVFRQKEGVTAVLGVYLKGLWWYVNIVITCVMCIIHNIVMFFSSVSCTFSAGVSLMGE
jgi:hypothetical protein